MEYDLDIFDAVEFNDLISLKMYWTDQIDINWQDLEGTDLLMTACKFGYEDIAEYLLTFNPNLNQTNNKGQTAIDIAQENNHKKIITLINEAKSGRNKNKKP